MKRLIRYNNIAASIDFSDLSQLPEFVEDYGGYEIRKEGNKYSIWIDHEYYGDSRSLEDAELIVDCLNDKSGVAASRITKKKPINASTEVIDGINFDFWYDNTFDDVCDVDCMFYPNGGYYAGNIYDCSGKIIGDFTGTDSVAIGRLFPGIFGD